MHNIGIKVQDNLWDRKKNTSLSRADLIAMYSLSNSQLDIIGRRLMLWHREDWWLMTLEDPHKMKAFQWTNQRNIQPIFPRWIAPPIHRTLDPRWNILKDRSQWYFLFNSLWGIHVEPKKLVQLGYSCTEPFGPKKRLLSLGRAMVLVIDASKKRMIYTSLEWVFLVPS